MSFCTRHKRHNQQHNHDNPWQPTQNNNTTQPHTHHTRTTHAHTHSTHTARTQHTPHVLTIMQKLRRRWKSTRCRTSHSKDSLALNVVHKQVAEEISVSGMLVRDSNVLPFRSNQDGTEDLLTLLQCVPQVRTMWGIDEYHCSVCRQTSKHSKLFSRVANLREWSWAHNV